MSGNAGMTDSIWHYDCKPTAEDADAEGFVTILDDGALYPRPWDTSAWVMRPLPWARTADVLRATGYVKPRKLHPAWRELDVHGWEGLRWVALLLDGVAALAFTTTRDARGFGYTHWQPCNPPAIWEDET